MERRRADCESVLGNAEVDFLTDSGVDVVLVERPFMFDLTEAIDSFDVEMDEEVDKDGFTVVQPLTSLLALDSARGFTSGLSDKRVVFVDAVDLETDKRLRGAEDSEGAGISENRVQFNKLDSFQGISSNGMGILSVVSGY